MRQKNSFLVISFILISIAISLISCSKSTDTVEPANRVPLVPAIDTANACPRDQATGISITPMLGWICSDPDGDSLLYDVYFGITTDTVPPLVSDSQAAKSYMPDTLEYETSYSWMIVARDVHGAATESPIWSFTTRIYHDDISPEAAITYPPADTTLFGIVEITAEATDNDGVAAVEFYIDAVLKAVDVTEPYSCLWNTVDYSVGQHYIFAVASDAAGNVDTSAIIPVTVERDEIPPSVSISSPNDGAIVSDTVDFSAEASDNDSVYAVEFKVDGESLYTDSTYPYSYHWVTVVYPDSSEHLLSVEATDGAGNVGISDTATVMVVNNNHSPQTILNAGEIYLNAVDSSSVMPGIELSWSGYDIDDYGPLNEFEWRLYGPFDDTVIFYTTTVYEDCIYDPAGDSFICQAVEVLDLNSLPEPVAGLPQPLRHSEGPDFASDPGDVWTNDSGTTLRDVFADLSLSITSQYKFVFWIRSRDSNHLPDQSPAFGQFIVIEPKFEHNIAVFDETAFTSQLGRWAPRDLDTVKAVMEGFIYGAGYGESDYDQDHDFFFTTNRKNYTGEPITPRLPTALDLFSHRLIIYHSDDLASGPNESFAGLMPYVFWGIDAGISGWVMSRNMGNAGSKDGPGTVLAKSDDFQYYFGMAYILCEGWFFDALSDPFNPIFNEQFVRAFANIPDYGNVDFDSALTDSRYPRWFADTSHVMVGLSEVGACSRTSYTTPTFLFVARDSVLSMFHGKVCAVLQERDDRRTACWMFTPSAMETSSMQAAFTKTIHWLGQPPEPGRSATAADRRERIRKFLTYLSDFAGQEEKTVLGVAVKPFVFVPAR